MLIVWPIIFFYKLIKINNIKYNSVFFLEMIFRESKSMFAHFFAVFLSFSIYFIYGLGKYTFPRGKTTVCNLSQRIEWRCDQSEPSQRGANPESILRSKRKDWFAPLRVGIMTEWYYFGFLNWGWILPHLLEWSSGSIRRGLPGSSGITTHLSLTRQMGKHPSRKAENGTDFETLMLTWLETNEPNLQAENKLGIYFETDFKFVC